MNAADRINAVINLEKPDRIPLAPFLDHWAATYTGITNAELMNDSSKRFEAILKTAQDFRWDMTFLGETINAKVLKTLLPIRVKFPGIDLPERGSHQAEELGFMTVEDYDVLESDGAGALAFKLATRIYPDMTIESFMGDVVSYVKETAGEAAILRGKGIEPAMELGVRELFSYFCQARTVQGALMDLRRHSAKVKAAGKRLVKDDLDRVVQAASQTPTKRVFIGMGRCSPTFLSSKLFEEFVFPELNFQVHSLIDAGLNPLFHCDTDWTKFFPYFLKFPKGKCIIELDGFSDIFKAKEILGNHMAIMGDVPATLQAEGSVDDVMNYCKRLIQEVGKHGGFILSSGCSVAANAKVKNIQAMTEAVEEWGKY